MDLFSNVQLSDLSSKCIIFHHEKYDGSGYPCGLSDNKILLPLGLFTVATSTMSSPLKDHMHQQRLSSMRLRSYAIICLIPWICTYTGFLSLCFRAWIRYKVHLPDLN